MIKDNRQKKVKDSKKNEEVCDNDIDYEDEITVPVNRSEGNTVQNAIALDTIPKMGQRVKFCQKGNNEWEVGTILSRAGKATGKYKNWRNVVDDEGNMSAVDWKLHVDRWEPLADEEIEIDERNFIDFMNNMERNNVDNEVSEVS